jgi:hypothetical protein
LARSKSDEGGYLATLADIDRQHDAGTRQWVNLGKQTRVKSRDCRSSSGVLGPDCAFLEKPFTRESLVRKVRELLDMPKPMLVQLAFQIPIHNRLHRGNLAVAPVIDADVSVL